MEPYLYLLIVGVALIVLYQVVSKAFFHFAHVWTIWDFQTGLLFRDGKLIKRLKAGKHRLWGAGYSVVSYDTRTAEVVVQGQEVITSDCATLKLTAVAQWRIVDPAKFHLGSANSAQSLYTVIQLALRQVVGGISLDEIIEQKSSFGPALLEIARLSLGDLGIEILQIDIRDVMLSSELKASYQSVLTARKASLAQLESARGDAAALRTLANSSRLFEKNPDLMTLKYLETLKVAGTSGYGNTLVIVVPEELSGLVTRQS